MIGLCFPLKFRILYIYIDSCPSWSFLLLRNLIMEVTESFSPGLIQEFMSTTLGSLPSFSPSLSLFRTSRSFVIFCLADRSINWLVSLPLVLIYLHKKNQWHHRYHSLHHSLRYQKEEHARVGGSKIMYTITVGIFYHHTGVYSSQVNDCSVM